MKFLRLLFTRNPKVENSYIIKNFEDAKKWALSKPHPYAPELCLWDYIECKCHYEAEQFKMINQFIKSIIGDKLTHV